MKFIARFLVASDIAIKHDNKLTPIPKNKFLEMHRGKKIGLVSSVSKPIKDILHLLTGSHPTKPVTRVDVESQASSGLTVKIFQYNEYILVESEMDNSKNKDVSWDDIEYNTIVYKILN